MTIKVPGSPPNCRPKIESGKGTGASRQPPKKMEMGSVGKAVGHLDRMKS